MTPEWISTFTVGERDMIILRMDDLEDDVFTDIVQTIHKHFPANMVLMLGRDETIESRSEEEVVELLKAISDHQEYREHRELAGE